MPSNALPAIAGDKDLQLQQALGRLSASPRPTGPDADPIVTASRRLPARSGGYTVGVLVQTNYGGDLTIAGVPVGREIGVEPPKGPVKAPEKGADGSVIVVVATDAQAAVKANLGSNPNLANNPNLGNQKIRYTVRSGDSLARIAQKFGVKVADLGRWNNWPADRILKPGQKLTVYVDQTRASGG